MDTFYGEDLAYIHHTGFGAHAETGGAQVLALLAETGLRGGRLIDLACGGGAFAKQASDAGFEVTGVDYSPAMVEIARQTAPRAEFQCASLFDYELPHAQVITVLGEGLNYCAAGEPDDRKLASFFERAAKALAPDGLLVFDVITTGGPEGLDGTAARTGIDFAVVSHALEDEANQELVRTISSFRELPDGNYRRSEEVHRVRLFDSAALQMMLKACGFEVAVADRYGDFPLLKRRRAFVARLMS